MRTTQTENKMKIIKAGKKGTGRGKIKFLFVAPCILPLPSFSPLLSFDTMGPALIIFILLVYFILVLLYNNYTYPLMILISIPLAIIGGLLALVLTMGALNLLTLALVGSAA